MIKPWLTGLLILFFHYLALGDENPLKIGVILPLSGPISNYGTEALRGINVAVQSVNAGGGVKGHLITLDVRDNAGDPSTTSQEATDLIVNQKVLAIIGPITSTNAAAAGAVCQQNGTPLILPVATNPYCTEIGEYVCRICFTDPFQGQALAEFAIQHLRSERVAIIYEKNSSYSAKLAEYFAITYKGMTGKVVYMESFEHDKGKLPAIVTEALKYQPDLLFLPMYYPEAIIVVNYLASIGSAITLLGGDGWESSEFFRLSRPYRGQIYISSHFSLQLAIQSDLPFVEDFEKMYSDQPNAISALAYDAAMIMADALRRATTITRSALQQALVTTNDFHGITGRITINEKRDVVKDVYILKAEEHKFIYETIISRFE